MVDTEDAQDTIDIPDWDIVTPEDLEEFAETFTETLAEDRTPEARAAFRISLEMILGQALSAAADEPESLATFDIRQGDFPIAENATGWQRMVRAFDAAGWELTQGRVAGEAYYFVKIKDEN